MADDNDIMRELQAMRRELKLVVWLARSIIIVIAVFVVLFMLSIIFGMLT